MLFIPSETLRVALIATALLTDGLDGYLARRYKMETKLGAILDPLTDKFFVMVALFVSYTNNLIAPWQIVAFLSRDIALFVLTVRAFFKGPLLSHPVRSIWPGKATTTLQFVVLTLLMSGYQVPISLNYLFILLGLLFLLEQLKLKATSET